MRTARLYMRHEYVLLFVDPAPGVQVLQHAFAAGLQPRDESIANEECVTSSDDPFTVFEHQYRLTRRFGREYQP